MKWKHTNFFPLFNREKHSPPPISVCAKLKHGLFTNNPIQLVITWSLERYGEKLWRKFVSASTEFGKLRVTVSSATLVMLVRGHEGILFICSQVNLEGLENIFFSVVGFTLTLDRIQGPGEEFKVKLTSEILVKEGKTWLLFDDLLRKRLIGTKLKKFS